jgi:uncharacterized Ntn-hydrolase superfamily protein
MTLSIAARCAESGQLGIAISSSSIAVGARCPWLVAGVGAVSSQNITLPALGQQILARLEEGQAPEQALKSALAEDRFSEYRQVTVMDASGRSAAFSGDKTLGIYHVVQGKDCVAAGNMLADQAVIAAMVAAFEATTGELTSRLITALQTPGGKPARCILLP